MVALATTIFVGLVVYGSQMIGWDMNSNEQVQLGLFLAFILGTISGYKLRG
jgi:hypothetical protein